MIDQIYLNEQQVKHFNKFPDDKHAFERAHRRAANLKLGNLLFVGYKAVVYWAADNLLEVKLVEPSIVRFRKAVK